MKLRQAKKLLKKYKPFVVVKIKNHNFSSSSFQKLSQSIKEIINKKGGNLKDCPFFLILVDDSKDVGIELVSPLKGLNLYKSTFSEIKELIDKDFK